MEAKDAGPLEVRSNDPLGMPVAAYDAGGGIELVACKQRDGSRLWAVRCGGNVLNKAGEWEYEPLPSNRDDGFLARCRFATPLEARDALLAYLRSA